MQLLHLFLNVRVGQLVQRVGNRVLKGVVEVAVAADAPCQLHVLLHDGLALGVQGQKLRVLEQLDQVVFCGFLDCRESVCLESEAVSIQIGYVLDQSHKWCSRQQQFC